jgi:hypothetical protein
VEGKDGERSSMGATERRQGGDLMMAAFEIRVTLTKVPNWQSLLETSLASLIERQLNVERCSFKSTELTTTRRLRVCENDKISLSPFTRGDLSRMKFQL